MQRIVIWSLLTLVVLGGATLKFTPSAASSSANQHLTPPRAAPRIANLILAPPPPPTTFTVTKTTDTNDGVCDADCSLREAVRAANADATANPSIIQLQAATTYDLTLTNATQENAAATGDLDITTTLHTVTIVGGGSSGPSATIIDAAGLTSGNMRDRAFQITGSGVTVIFQDLTIRLARPPTTVPAARAPTPPHKTIPWRDYLPLASAEAY